MAEMPAAQEPALLHPVQTPTVTAIDLHGNRSSDIHFADAALEDVLLTVLCGHSLPRSGSQFAELSKDVMFEFLVPAIRATHWRSRVMAGLVTPPAVRSRPVQNVVIPPLPLERGTAEFHGQTLFERDITGDGASNSLVIGGALTARFSRLESRSDKIGRIQDSNLGIFESRSRFFGPLRSLYTSEK